LSPARRKRRLVVSGARRSSEGAEGKVDVIRHQLRLVRFAAPNVVARESEEDDA
jgi:hypothetical protein